MSSRPPSLRERALGYLARREHSRSELERKLVPHAEDPGEVQAVLDELESRGWLSERRVMEQVLHARREKYGGQRIAHELREKGIAEDLVDEALRQLKDSELDAARSVWRKKFGRLPKDANERGKQARFLQARGFNLETVLKVLRQDEE